MPTNFANGVLSQGVPLIPGVPLTTGTYFFVCSVAGIGSDNNTGRDKLHPLATLQAAINKCTAGRGDTILLMPGHAETVTSSNITLNVSGVQVVGLGTGSLRPTFTYGAAAATINVTAANCSVTNCLHVANFLSVASAYTTAAAKDFTVSRCDFIDTSSSLDFLSIVTTSSTDNAADGLTFVGNYVYGLPTSPTAVISVLANILRMTISDNVVDRPGATNNAGQLVTLSSKSAGATRIQRNCLSLVGNSALTVGILGTGSSTASDGIVSDNRVASLSTTTALIFTAGSKLSFVENYLTGAADASGAVWPVGATQN